MRPLLILLALGLAAPASAAETVSYSYDTRGRIVKVEHSGSVNNGVITTYGFDRADNRLSRTTTGAGARFIIVPLKGGTPVPISL